MTYHVHGFPERSSDQENLAELEGEAMVATASGARYSEASERQLHLSV